MKVIFTCQTCNSPVEYEFAGVETHRLRRYGVRHYVRAEECPACAAPQPSSDSFVFEMPEEPGHLSERAPQSQRGSSRLTGATGRRGSTQAAGGLPRWPRPGSCGHGVDA